MRNEANVRQLMLALLLFPALAFAQAGPPPPPPDDVEPVHPQGAEPDMSPPAPPDQNDQAGILQSPGYDAPRTYAPPPARPDGQWVYTAQYGWVWMPYGNQYVNEGVYGAAAPRAYVYSARFGWSWVAAPWLWGSGARPWFGRLGPARFGWYRGLSRPGYGWGHYRGGAPVRYRATRPMRGGYRSGGHSGRR